MKRRLLLVDDEANLLRAVTWTLRDAGYDVTAARSGPDALIELAKSIPDLIISDIRMPGLDGYELLRRLRANGRTNLIPVIFLTAKGTLNDRITGLHCGADAYITKPFDPDELLAIIKNILERVERTHAALARNAELATGATADIADPSLAKLTEAESRVALAIARGLSNKEIAGELGLSVRTVETHVRHILAKKHWSNRVEIAGHIIARRAAS